MVMDYARFSSPETSFYAKRMEEELSAILDLEGLADFARTKRLPREFFLRMNLVMENYDHLREAAISQSGLKPICKKGCSSCCLLLPSGMYSSELILLYDSMQGEARDPVSEARRVMDKHLQNVQTFTYLLSKHMPEGTESVEIDIKGELFGRTILEYMALGRSCGFLGEGGICTSYQARPIACRMHYRLNDPDYCKPANRRDDGRMEIHPGPDAEELLRRVDDKLNIEPSPILANGMVDTANMMMGARIERV